MKTILLVDDEQRMLDLLGLYVSPSYQYFQALSGKTAIELLKEKEIDAVILDVMMPEMDGWKVCEEVRKFSNVPIIMLTARVEKQDVVKGLKLGADDYVTKPFDEEELLMRLETVLRRVQPPEQQKVVHNGLCWDETDYLLCYRGEKIVVTPREFQLIGLFMKHPNRVFSRELLLESVWGYQAYTEYRTIDSHIRNIREKLRQAAFPVDDFLLTVWGVGYKWIK